MITEELRALIVAAGLAPSATNLAQVTQAVRNLAAISIQGTSANTSMGVLLNDNGAIGYNASFVFNPAIGEVGITGAGAGISETPVLALAQAGTQLFFLPNSAVAAYNPIVGAGDSSIIGTGGVITVAPYSGAACGFRAGAGVAQITGAAGITLYGNVTATGGVSAPGFNQTSDPKLKKRLRLIKDPLIILSKVNGWLFHWRKSGKADAGLRADEWEHALPECVQTIEGVRHINVMGPIGLLVASANALRERLERAEARIAELESCGGEP